MNNLLKIGTKASAFAFFAALFVACSSDPGDPGTQYAAQMYDDPAYESLKQVDKNTVNPGGLNMREPADNTIARGKLAYYNHIPKDQAELAGTKLQNPLRPTEANLKEGEVLYARFCSPCHGAEGLGDGLVGQKFKGVANLNQDRLKQVPLGHIYHVIVHGRGRMMPHGTQVNPEERWKISMYVRNVLQGAGEAAAADDAGNVDAPDGASDDVNTNPVTGTLQPSGGATLESTETKELNIEKNPIKR